MTDGIVGRKVWWTSPASLDSCEGAVVAVGAVPRDDRAWSLLVETPEGELHVVTSPLVRTKDPAGEPSADDWLARPWVRSPSGRWGAVWHRWWQGAGAPNGLIGDGDPEWSVRVGNLMFQLCEDRHAKGLTLSWQILAELNRAEILSVRGFGERSRAELAGLLRSVGLEPKWWKP